MSDDTPETLIVTARRRVTALLERDPGSPFERDQVFQSVGVVFHRLAVQEAEIATLRQEKQQQLDTLRQIIDGLVNDYNERGAEIATLRQERDKWLKAFNESEQFQNGPTKRAEAAEAENARLRAGIGLWKARADHGFDPDEPQATSDFWDGVRRVVDALLAPPAEIDHE